MALMRSGDLPLVEGVHKILLQFEQQEGAYAIEWSWALDGAAPTPVPRWALSTGRTSVARAALWLHRLWVITTGVSVLVVVMLGFTRLGLGSANLAERSRARRAALLCLLAVALGWFYYVAALEHAATVNRSKARGDQSAWLLDAQQVYANWHGHTPPMLIGQRLRTPLYAGYLSLSYTPRMSNLEYFEEAKRWNVRLSLVLLAALAVVFARVLPLWPAVNLTLIVAFGYFIFKAGYSQPELLLYTLFLGAFLLLCRLLMTREKGWRAIAVGALTGVTAGLTQLTKGIMLPLIVIFLAVYVARDALNVSNRRSSIREVTSRVAVALVMTACFVGVLFPYISNTKRVFDSYFYHGTTSVLAWFDSAAEQLATVNPKLGPDGRIDIPRAQLPTPTTYWRTHSVRQIAARLRDGFTDIVVTAYTTYWYFKYVVLYVLSTAAVVAANHRAFFELARRNAAMVAFLTAYGVAYLAYTAFFSVISGMGPARFVLMHVMPLLFVLSWIQTQSPFNLTRWRMAGVDVTPVHVHLFVSATLALDMAFLVWPRVMTTYGGF